MTARRALQTLHTKITSVSCRCGAIASLFRLSHKWNTQVSATGTQLQSLGCVLRNDVDPVRLEEPVDGALRNRRLLVVLRV